MIHPNYNRVNIRTGEIETLRFADIDARGSKFDKGLPETAALLMVNRWNYLNTLQPYRAQWFYYLPTVEGAA